MKHVMPMAVVITSMTIGLVPTTWGQKAWSAASSTPLTEAEKSRIAERKAIDEANRIERDRLARERYIAEQKEVERRRVKEPTSVNVRLEDPQLSKEVRVKRENAEKRMELNTPKPIVPDTAKSHEKK